MKWKTSREKTPSSWQIENKTSFVEVSRALLGEKKPKRTVTNTDRISSRERKRPWGLRNGVFPSNHSENKT